MNHKNEGGGTYYDPDFQTMVTDLDADRKNEEDVDVIGEVLKDLTRKEFSGDFIVNFRNGQPYQYKKIEICRLRKD